MLALKGVWGTFLFFAIVMGGIHGGAFTLTEAAGIAAGGAFLIALIRGALTWRIFLDVLADSARTTAILFTVLIGALIILNFVNRAGLPDGLLALVTGNDLSPLMVIAIIIAIYIVLGCVFESLSMLLLTIPVFFPVVKELSYAGLGSEQILVWFGIVAVVVTEISLITPPVGLNIFVLSGVVKDVSTGTIFKGVTPFWCADILRLAVIVAIPAISLYLPRLFYH
jgi:TRAP-type C4-dicarboxylate transport system permease large subunit